MDCAVLKPKPKKEKKKEAPPEKKEAPPVQHDHPPPPCQQITGPIIQPRYSFDNYPTIGGPIMCTDELIRVRKMAEVIDSRTYAPSFQDDPYHHHQGYRDFAPIRNMPRCCVHHHPPSLQPPPRPPPLLLPLPYHGYAERPLPPVVYHRPSPPLPRPMGYYYPNGYYGYGGYYVEDDALGCAIM